MLVKRELDARTYKSGLQEWRRRHPVEDKQEDGDVEGE